METVISKSEKNAPGRPREFEMDVVLDRAIVAFSRFGYSASSISDLAEAIELTPGSIYKAFGDKRGLLNAAFDRYLAVRSEILNELLGSARTGREKVAAVLQSYTAYSHGEVGKTGCMVVGSLIEFAHSDAVLKGRVSKIFASHKARLQQFLRDGQADGSINARIDCDEIAATFLCILQGMRVLGKVGRREDEVMGVMKTAMKMLD